MFLKIIRTASFKYIFTKYFAYGLQFFTAILIAEKLGVYYFGIYSFVNLVIQYLSYSNFGVEHALSVIMSSEKNFNEEKAQKILSTSLSLTGIISLILMILTVISFVIGFIGNFDKYLLTEYLILIIFIAIIQNFNALFRNLFRIYGKLNEINFSILILPFLQFCVIFWFTEKDLFWSLVSVILIGRFSTLILYYIKTPLTIKFRFSLDKSITKSLLFRGFTLLIYNVSFYFIIISAKTIVSYFYSVEEFGLFNFANSLVHAIMMLISSLGFLFYPKMINKFSINEETGNTIEFLEKTRKIYLTTTFFIIFTGLFFAPLVFNFLPDYTGSYPVLKFLLFAQLLISNSFGYSTLLIQRKREKILTMYGILAVIIVITSGVFFAKHLRMPIEFLGLSVILGVVIYNFMVIYSGNQITNQFPGIIKLISYVYSYKYTLPIVSFLVFEMIFDNKYFVSFITLAIYAILNYKEILYSYSEGKKILLNKNSLNIVN